MENRLKGKLIALVLFSMSFAYIESAVVVYLRAIFYPDGFHFPISEFLDIDGFGSFLFTEIAREAATMVVILTTALMIGANKRQKTAFFLIIFAVWDIFYYVWLKVLIDWPASILDWDVLFLIPHVWASPVLAPIISSLLMLIIAFLLLNIPKMTFGWPKIALIFIFSLMIIAYFCLSGTHTAEQNYRSYFNWPIFLLPHFGILITMLDSVVRSTKKTA